jgi:hypothetical protein
MHALAQDGVGLAPLGRVADEAGKLGLHAPPRYTFAMKALAWFVIVACLAAIAVVLWLLARKEMRRRRESEARSAALVAEAAEAIRSKVKTPEPSARD